MKLEGPYNLRITGDPARFIASARSRSSFIHLIERLFSGEEVDVSELESWGIGVELVDDFITIPRLEE